MSLWRKDVAETTESGITYANCREEAPGFKRLYTAHVTNRVDIEVKARTFLGSRSYHGELRQSDGRTVWFEPTRVADKILDSFLVPLVEKICAEIFSIDKAYMRGPLDRFTDEKGVTWIRA